MPPPPDQPTTDPQHRVLTTVILRHLPLSITALLVLPALLWWLHGRHGSAPLMSAWLGLMWVLAAALALAAWRLWRHPPGTARAQRLWHLGLIPLATLVGLAWAAPVPLTLHEQLPLFHLILYASLCAVVSSGAMHLSLLPGVFIAFSATVLIVLMAGAYWIFPADWPYVLAALALFAAITLRHGWQHHRFMQRQFSLEEALRQMSAQATQALLEKNHFLSAASHDLRQPVYAMGLALAAAQQTHGKDPQLGPLLEHLRRCAQAIQFMLASLLDLSRIESGHQSPRLQTLDARTLLADVPLLFGADARARGLRLRVRAPRQALPVRADAALLRQALFNLVQNALRYTSYGGVLVALRPRAGHALLQVWDTGIGITAKRQASIFRPFERGLETALVPAPGATHHAPAVASHGLGLAVVARCAALLGAQTGVHSAPGRGSCFWLRLPLVPADDLAAGLAPPPTPTPAALPRLGGRCLVVEDDPDVTRAWRLLLPAWGVQARFADSHASAHQLLDEGFAPQALVCDLRLRGGDNGWQLLQSLAARCPSAGCLLLSADLHAPEFAEADEQGYLVLHKPVAPELLHQMLAGWLGYRR
ncbi:MAG: hybrid sensor histidine kinase/response regulator [Pseudomonadota bacterium]|nr:hybrid sensor histidine kinase/response regulator [Pseudomonadota bacterium]